MKIPLFDIDGTLLTSGGGNKVHREGFNYALRKVFNLSTADISDIKTDGKIDKSILYEIATLHGISDVSAKEKMDAAVAAVEEYFFENKEKFQKPAAGVVELLESLKQKSIPLGLLTGNMESIAWEKLKQANIDHFFSFGAFGDLAYRRVDLIEIALTRLNNSSTEKYTKNDLCIIGDSPLDIQCAQDGKIDVLAVATGNYSKAQLEQHNPTHIVTSLKEKGEVFTFLNILNNQK